MPTYCYRDLETDEPHQVFMPIAEMERRQSKEGTVLLDNGRLGKRDLKAEMCGGQKATCWPMASEAMGVAHHQVKEATEADRRNGVPTDYTPDGRPIYTSRAHRKRHCELHGFYDRNGGYSDPQQGGRR